MKWLLVLAIVWAALNLAFMAATDRVTPIGMALQVGPAVIAAFLLAYDREHR